MAGRKKTHAVKVRKEPPSLSKVKRAVRKATAPRSSKDIAHNVAARERLIAATGSLLRDSGFHDITLERAARRAKVSATTARVLFRTKLHLVGATLEQQLEEDLDATEGEIIGTMHANDDTQHGITLMLVAQLKRHFERGWGLYVDMDLLARDNESRELLRQLQNRLKERACVFIAAMQQRGIITSAYDAEAVWFLWSALLDGTVLRARVSPGQVDIHVLAGRLAPLIAFGLSPTTRRG